MNKHSNFDFFEKFFYEFELCALECKIVIVREQLIGRKKDLIALSKEIYPELAELKESTFEEFFRKLNCKFLSAPISKKDMRVRDLVAPLMRARKK